jgi:raffinose/stachyose/melibiose transport system substrate-binding protein
MEEENMRKDLNRVVLAALLAVCVVALVGAGGSKEAPKSQAAKPVTVAFTWQTLSDTVVQAWKDYLFTPFEKEFPNIKVDFRTIPNALAAVKVQIASNEGPDMFMLDAFDTKNFVDADKLIATDKYVKQYGWDKFIFPWALKAGQVKGVQYALPKAYETSFLMYNKDLLDKNGWPVPRTRAEMEFVAAEAVKKGLLVFNYGNASLPLLNQWLYNHYLSAYSGPAAIRKLFKGQIKFSDADIKGAFALLVADWQKGWFNNKNSAAISINDARSLFYNQKAVFSTEGSWIIQQVAADMIKFNYGATKWPSMRDGMPAMSGVGQGKAIALTKSSKVPDEAATLLNFMYTRKDLGAQGAARGMQPLPLETPDDLYPKDAHKNTMIMHRATWEVAKDPNQISYLPWTFYPPKANQYMYENLDAVFYGKLSLDDYLAKSQAQLDQDLKEGYVFAID